MKRVLIEPVKADKVSSTGGQDGRSMHVIVLGGFCATGLWHVETMRSADCRFLVEPCHIVEQVEQIKINYKIKNLS